MPEYLVILPWIEPGGSPESVFRGTPQKPEENA